MNTSRRITSFLLLAFGSTWTIAGIGAFMGVRATAGLPYMALAGACMLMPALSAIVQQRLIDRAPWAGLGLIVRGVNWKLMAATALVGVAIVPVIFLVMFVLGDGFGIDAFSHARVTTEQMVSGLQSLMEQAGQSGKSSSLTDLIARVPGWLFLVIGLLAAVLAACTVNLPFMLGEELGWRGYLYQATAEWPSLKRVLFTGMVWGLWHAPLILMGHNYPNYPIAGIGLMVVFCTLLAFLFDWSRTRTHAVWGPCILHGIINGSAGLFAVFAWGGHPLVASPVGVAGFVGLAVLVLVVIVVDGTYRRQFVRTPLGSYSA